MSAGRERTEDIRNEEARIKRLLGLDVARLAIGADFEGQQYAPLGVNVIEFVNVSTSIAAAQTGSGGPAQVTGLSAVVNSNTQITLSWTAVAGATSYNVYYGFISGGASNLAGNVTSAGAIHSSLTPGTTYWYQVAAVNAVGEGSLSTELSATTTAPPVTADLWLPLNNSLTDASGNGATVTYTPTGGNSAYGTPGKFGSHYAIVNYPTTSTNDSITVAASTSTALDFTNGFSYSLWVYMESAATGYILSKRLDNSNFVGLYYNNNNQTVACDILKTGATTSTRGGTIGTGAWNHIVLTFDGTTPRIYVNKVFSSTSIGPNFGATATTSLFIGNLANSSGGQTFRGRIDEVQYFKGVVLTQTQVNNLFSTNAP